MSVNVQRFIFGWSIILFWVFVAVHAFAADLAIPHRQALRAVPLPPPARSVVPAVPIAPAIPSPKAPQLCLETGKEPFPGQTLQADPSCPTGLRWKYQK
jgi:hypothetical protein